MIDEFLHWLYTSLGPGPSVRGMWRSTCYHYLGLSQDEGDAIVERGKDLGLLEEDQNAEVQLTLAGLRYVQDRLPPQSVPELVHTFGPHSDAVEAMGFVSTGFVTASVDGVVRWWVNGDLVLERRGDPFSNAGLSPDGSVIVFNGEGMLWVWDAASGAELRSPFGVSAVGRLAFSADSKVLAISDDCDLHVVRDWEPIAVLSSADMIDDFALSPDGSLAAVASRDQTVRVWDIATGEIVRDGYMPQPMCVAFSAVGSVMAAGGEDELALWTRSGYDSFGGAPGNPMSLAFSPDGTVLASGDWDGTIRFWSVAGKRLIRTAKHRDMIQRLAWSPDGSMLASVDGTARLWDPNTGDPLQEPMPGHTDPVKAGISEIAFSPSGDLLATTCSDHTVKLWRTVRPTLPRMVELPAHDSDIAAIAFSRDSSMFMSAAEDGVVCWWDVANSRVIDANQLEPFEVAAFSPNARILATNDMDHNLLLWIADTGDAMREPFDVGMVGSVTFTADGTMLGVSEGDTVTVWTVPDGQRVGSFSVGEDIEDYALSTSLLGTITPHEVRLWNTKSGALIASSHRDGWLTRVRLSPDGRTMVACGVGEITWWDTTTGTFRTIEIADRACPVTASFSASGILATGNDDGLIQFWQDGTIIAESSERHQGDVWDITWSPDATMLASSGADDTIRLWNTTTGKRIHTYTATVDSLAFAPNGSLLAGQGRDNVVRIWETT